MKNTFLFLTLFTLSFMNVQAQTNNSERTSLFSVYFGWNRSDVATEVQRADLDKIVVQLVNCPTESISIVGWADATGTSYANTIMSERRAQSVKDYLIRKGIAAQRFTVVGKGTDVNATSRNEARRVDVIITLHDAPSHATDTPSNTPQPVVSESTTTEQPSVSSEEEEVEELTQLVLPKREEPKQQRIVEIIEETESHKSQEQCCESHFSLRTNLLYWLGALPNLGFEWQPCSAVGVIVNGGWAPWASDNWAHNWAGWFVSPEIRFYLGAKRRWFAGVNMVAGEYNLKPGDLGRKGSVIAGGVTGGYKMRLSNVFDMDFSLGLGYGQLKYRGYRHLDSGENRFGSTWVVRNGFLPTQAGVSLIWKLK